MDPWIFSLLYTFFLFRISASNNNNIKACNKLFYEQSYIILHKDLFSFCIWAKQLPCLKLWAQNWWWYITLIRLINVCPIAGGIWGVCWESKDPARVDNKRKQAYPLWSLQASHCWTSKHKLELHDYLCIEKMVVFVSLLAF